MARSAAIHAEISVAEAAAEAGMHPKKMQRVLIAADKKHGGILVRHSERGCKKYFTTRPALKKAFPEWFEDERATVEEVSELKGQIVDLKREVKSLAAGLRDMRAAARDWFKRETAKDREGQKTQLHISGSRETRETKPNE